jgi:hypothetical protein
MDPTGERIRRSYLVTKSYEVRVDAFSSAEARATAETIFQLKPNSKAVTTNVHVERMRD